jgi:DNA excision repair protein ERCC-3
MDWKSTLTTLQDDVARIDQLITDLQTYRDEKTAEIAHYLRADDGIELDLDAIRATLTRPYTLLPIDEHQAWLIHWRGVKMPIFGWVVAQEPAFIKAKVTRSMDLLTPLPGWMKQELGWKPPEHKAVIDGTRTSLQLTEGDSGSFKRKYGKFLGGSNPDGTMKIKGGDAWIRLVAALVRDGILPYAPTPVRPEDWRGRSPASSDIPDILKEIIHRKEKEAGAPYIQRAVDEFFQKGAILVNYPPGSGKTLTTCVILNHMVGRVLLLADTTMLIEQWRDRLKLFVNNDQVEITLSTYQGAQKYLAQEWDLIIPDEAQRLPANTFSKLAFVKTKYRLGLTGTAWREDDRQHLIVALSGFPVAIRWSEMITAGVLKRPRIVVATVQSDSAKTAYVKQLVAKARGRVLIFCDWLKQGQELADSLDVPFIHGDSGKNKLQLINESQVAVVSRIGDRGISLPDLRLVIEVAGAGSAREQFAQRVGRLLHGDFEGTFVTVFTPEEAQKYRGRVFGVEAELAGSVDIEFINVGNVSTETPARVVKSARPRSTTAPSPRRTSSPEGDELSQVLALPAVAAKVAQARSAVGQDSVGYVERVLRYCWSTGLSPKEIAEGLGITGHNAVSRISAACKAVTKVGLMTVDENGRYQVNQDEISRLRALSSLRR